MRRRCVWCVRLRQARQAGSRVRGLPRSGAAARCVASGAVAGGKHARRCAVQRRRDIRVAMAAGYMAVGGAAVRADDSVKVALQVRGSGVTRVVRSPCVRYVCGVVAAARMRHKMRVREAAAAAALRAVRHGSSACGA